MKKSTNFITGIGIMTLLTGCGGISWVNLDNTKANSNNIKKAKTKCNVNKKIYNLVTDKETTDDIVFILKQQGKKADGFVRLHKIKEKKINNEINTCMKKEGFLRQE